MEGRHGPGPGLTWQRSEFGCFASMRIAVAAAAIMAVDSWLKMGDLYDDYLLVAGGRVIGWAAPPPIIFTRDQEKREDSL
jgi:hypothetical protein